MQIVTLTAKMQDSNVTSDGISSVTMTTERFETREEAAAVAARFPRFVGAKVQAWAPCDGRPQTFDARIVVSLWPSQDNPANETGAKRILRALKVVDAEPVMPRCQNARLVSVDELTAAMNAVVGK